MKLDRAFLIAATLAAVGATASRAAEAALAPDPAPLIAEDDWIHKPTSNETAWFYPPRAARMARQGEVRLRCAIEDTGQVSDCEVASESVSRFGFGEAALKMSRLFLIRPRVTSGAIVTIPVAFRLR